jgi:hypothetical protein
MTKPDLENNWFKKYEKEMLENALLKKEKLIKENAALYGQKELEKCRAAHWMKCPKCGHDMEETTLENILVDTCTFCKGVYFDREEIESLLMRKTQQQRFSFYRKFFDMD